MKRLKLKQPFRGYEERVITIAVIISPFAGLAAFSLSEDKKVCISVYTYCICYDIDGGISDFKTNKCRGTVSYRASRRTAMAKP